MAMTNEELENLYWGLQGRANAAEMMMVSMILTVASVQPDPFGWVQAYVEGMRRTLDASKMDAMESDKAKRLRSETKFYMDDMLAQIIANAGVFRREGGK